MSNLVRKRFKFNTTVEIPAGVKFVTARAVRKNSTNCFSRFSGNGTQQNPLFLDNNGNMYSFGLGTNGVLGDNSAVAKSSPSLVVGGLKFQQFTQSFSNVWAIDQFNTCYAWGLNTNGQLADGAVTTRSSPQLVVGGLKWNCLGVGDTNLSNFSGITENGLMYTAGLNANGQLGVNDVTPRSSPTLVVGGLQWWPDPKAFGYTGARHFGITKDGDLYMWGGNIFGELGDGSTTPRSSPTLVVGGLKWQMMCGVSGTTTSSGSSVGLTTGGQVYAWGMNDWGNLGDGTVAAKSSPVLMLGGLTDVVDITSTEHQGHSVMLLRANGQAYATGVNQHGQLGVGNTQDRSSPTLVIGGLNFIKIIGGSKSGGSNAYYVGLTSDGSLYAWGGNSLGQLGVGDNASRSSPTLVVGGLKFANFSVDRTSAGVRAVATDGRMYTWGGNANGQLGDGTVAHKSSPVLVLGALTPTNQDFVSEASIPVIPGNSYDLKMQQPNVFFGSYPVGVGPFDYIEIEYFQ